MKRSQLIFLAIVLLLASGIVSYFVTTGCLRYGFCIIAQESKSVSMVEALGFAGTMATILAFVATFAIALMAIDAFAISSSVKRSEENIDRFSGEVDEIEKRLKSVSSSITVLELLIKEIDESSEFDDHVYSLFEIIAKAAGASEAVTDLVLKGRNSARNRRTRVNGIRSLVSLRFDGTSPSEFSSTLPELINLARGDDEAAQWILIALRDLNVPGIPDEFSKSAKKSKPRQRRS